MYFNNNDNFFSYKEISLEEALSGKEVFMTFSVNYRFDNIS